MYDFIERLCIENIQDSIFKSHYNILNDHGFIIVQCNNLYTDKPIIVFKCYQTKADTCILVKDDMFGILTIPEACEIPNIKPLDGFIRIVFSSFNGCFMDMVKQIMSRADDYIIKMIGGEVVGKL